MSDRPSAPYGRNRGRVVDPSDRYAGPVIRNPYAMEYRLPLDHDAV